MCKSIMLMFTGLILCSYFNGIWCVPSFSTLDTFNVTLSTSITPDFTEMYGKIHTIKNETRFDLYNINEDVDFLIFQVHSQIYKLTLYQNEISRKTSINGTNVGMYSPVLRSGGTLSFNVKNFNVFPVKVYISIHGYPVKAPIPGGCNMEFQLETSPFLNVTNTKDLITVEGSPGKANRILPCEKDEKNVTYSLYQLFMTEQDWTEDNFMKNIALMVNIGNIKKVGTNVPLQTGYAPLRRLFSTYRGTGSIYVLVVTSSGGQAAYVPAHNYGCDLTDLVTCRFAPDTTTKVFLSLLAIIGLFVAYKGLIYSTAETIISAFLAGVFISCLFFPFVLETESNTILWASLGTGLTFAAMFSCIWCICSCMFIPLLLTTFLFGILMASVTFFGLPGGLSIMENQLSSSLLFLSVVFGCQGILLIFSSFGKMFASAALGSYATIVAFDTFLGSNLKYIILNTIRRVTVPDFYTAVHTPPIQHWDIFLSIVWISMFVTGCIYQLLSISNLRIPRSSYGPINETSPLMAGPRALYGIVINSRGTRDRYFINNRTDY